MKMNPLSLPATPESYRLEKAFLSTFDLDENLLSGLIHEKDADKFLVVRGDGEYVPFEGESPIKKRIVNVFFESTNKKLPNGKFQPVRNCHAKIWFFVYENDGGDRVSKLIIQSMNIYPYDSLEVALSFSGKKTEEKQIKNDPLTSYFKSLLPFLDEEKKAFVESLIEEIPYYCFQADGGDFQADDFEFIAPNCEKISLFDEEFDEILIISPFINVESIQALLLKKKEGGRSVVLSQAKIEESLILNDVEGVQYLSPAVSDKFVHAKIYLLRKGDVWDSYAGSMNLTDHSVSKNIEAMVHLRNVKNIESIESFLKAFIGRDVEEELRQYSQNFENKDNSPVFNDAYRVETRIRYIKKLLSFKKHAEEEMNRVSSYLLSSQSAKDLSDLAEFRKAIIPTRLCVVTGNNKKRYVYKPSLEEKALLGLVNYSLHQYDYVFSKNVFLHISDRGLENAFIKIHETKDLKDFYFFRTDIHSFDPSIDKEILCNQMDQLFSFDHHFCRFAKSIINERRYHLENDEQIYEDDIIHQTGLPLGGFFENVYLYDFDFALEKAPLYIRCSDDILIGSKSKEEVETLSKKAIALLKDKKLSISEAKTSIVGPGETTLYLGWAIVNGEVDFAEIALRNIQKTIKKKTKDLLIMYGRNKIPNTLRLPSVVRFVRHYQKSEFFISCFKRITTTEGLKKIDRMIMDLIRAVVAGKTGNSKYKIKYESIQAFGYKSLVNQYYDYISGKK